METLMLTGWRDLEDTLGMFDLLQREMGRAFAPRDALQATRDRRERFVRRPTLGLGVTLGRAAWPVTNVFETKEAFVVRADVPGMAEGDVSVSVEEDALVIRGERKAEVPEGYRVHLRERSSVAFTRKVPLPAHVDADGVTATLSEGVLTVKLPKAREALPRQIAVKAG
jgi:HSP20 family protein